MYLFAIFNNAATVNLLYEGVLPKGNEFAAIIAGFDLVPTN